MKFPCYISWFVFKGIRKESITRPLHVFCFHSKVCWRIYKRQLIGLSLVQGMACPLVGERALPEQLLSRSQFDPQEQTSVTFYQNINIFYQENIGDNCRLLIVHYVRLYVLKDNIRFPNTISLNLIRLLFVNVAPSSKNIVSVNCS